MSDYRAARQDAPTSLARQVKGAVLWRSGSQIAGQLITWASTFLVIRALDPTDYGLVAMTQVVLTLLGLADGWGFASALVREEKLEKQRIAQVLGLLILLNGTLAAVQIAVAPLAAAYFRQPMVTDLLRVQALFYLATPFLAVSVALLSRRLDFKRQGQVNLVAAALSATTAVTCAYAGLGVWALVAAPGVYWLARAIGMSWAARLRVRPSFRFVGIGRVARFGGTMLGVQFLWFIQSQSDIFIGGRALSVHELGIYTTALFLTQILAAKFIPPLNDVAFSAYSKIQHRADVLPIAFAKSIRLIMLVTLPFYLGLAVTAEPLVRTFLGEKWLETIVIVPILSLAMPLMTLQILFSPATNATGRAGIHLRTALAGAMLMPAAFLIGIHWGKFGLACAWLAGTAAHLLVTVALSLPVLGVAKRALLAAIAPGLLAASIMAAAVWTLDRALPPLEAPARLLVLVLFGMATYAGLLLLFARPIVTEVLQLVRGSEPEAVPAC